MRYWLVKSEPDAFSWDQQVANGVEPWTGVRNHTAKLNLRAMTKGRPGILLTTPTSARRSSAWWKSPGRLIPDPTADKGDGSRST